MSVDAAKFTGDIPAKYDRGLGPVLFVPYAEDLAARVSAAGGGTVLELAAGTGILAERLAKSLGSGVTVIATDLNDAMLDIARRRTSGLNVKTQVVDACQIPFGDETFAAIVCQFGVMFFPDKIVSFKEARRVLQEGGTYFFNVWETREHNDFARCVRDVLNAMFKGSPPKFYDVPFGYADTDVVTGHLREAGFEKIRFERVTKECSGESAEAFCEGLIEGNPVVVEIQALGENAIANAKAELMRRFTSEYGDKPFISKMQAIVYEVTK